MCLSEILAQFGWWNLFGAIDADVDFVEQLLIFGHKLRGITRAKEYSQEEYGSPDAMFSCTQSHKSHISAYKDTKIFAKMQIFMYLCIKNHSFFRKYDAKRAKRTAKVAN